MKLTFERFTVDVRASAEIARFATFLIAGTVLAGCEGSSGGIGAACGVVCDKIATCDLEAPPGGASNCTSACVEELERSRANLQPEAAEVYEACVERVADELTGFTCTQARKSSMDTDCFGEALATKGCTDPGWDDYAEDVCSRAPGCSAEQQADCVGYVVGDYKKSLRCLSKQGLEDAVECHASCSQITSGPVTSSTISLTCTVPGAAAEPEGADAGPDRDDCCAADDPCGFSDNGRCDCSTESWDVVDCDDFSEPPSIPPPPPVGQPSSCCVSDDPCGFANDRVCLCRDQPWEAADCVPPPVAGASGGSGGVGAPPAPIPPPVSGSGGAGASGMVAPPPAGCLQADLVAFQACAEASCPTDCSGPLVSCAMGACISQLSALLLNPGCFQCVAPVLTSMACAADLTAMCSTP